MTPSFPFFLLKFPLVDASVPFVLVPLHMIKMIVPIMNGAGEHRGATIGIVNADTVRTSLTADEVFAMISKAMSAAGFETVLFEPEEVHELLAAALGVQ